MNTPKIILKTEDLAIGYSPAQVLLNNLKFNIYLGDMIGLLGGNGIGKTTLLKTLAGLLPPIQGEVLINGQSLRKISLSDMAKERAVVLTEKINLPYTSVEDVIKLGRYPHRYQHSNIHQEKIDQVINLFALDGFRKKYFNQLSDGQRQKVLLATALAQDTPLLLLDEPTTYLDIPHKMEIFQVLKKISREQKKAILLTTHDWPVCLEMATRVWAVDNQGHWVDGMPEDLILTGDLQRIFNGENFQFDSQSATFRSTYRPSLQGKIMLQGPEGTRKKWTAHALEKVGVEVLSFDFGDPRNQKLAVVDVAESSGWIIHHSGKTTECKTLTDVFNSLQIF